MNKLRAELFLLRWNLLLLAGCIAIAGVIVFSVGHYHQQIEVETHAAEQAATRMRNETTRLQNEDQEMRRKITQYGQIAAHGIIGPEKRLDWVELMRAIQKDRKLLGLEYEIYPQLPVSTSLLNNNAPGFEFMVSAMQLRMPLLHEEDLTHFIDDLRKHAPAYVRVRSCKLSRAISDTAALGDLPPQLNADCQIDWITIRDKAAGVAS
jgi:hypothetical protein